MRATPPKPKVHVVFCDHPKGCDSFKEGDNPAEARARAHATGWRVDVNGQDFCPLHAR